MLVLKSFKAEPSQWILATSTAIPNLSLKSFTWKGYPGYKQINYNLVILVESSNDTFGFQKMPKFQPSRTSKGIQPQPKNFRLRLTKQAWSLASSIGTIAGPSHCGHQISARIDMTSTFSRRESPEITPTVLLLGQENRRPLLRRRSRTLSLSPKALLSPSNDIAMTLALSQQTLGT